MLPGTAALHLTVPRSTPSARILYSGAFFFLRGLLSSRTNDRGLLWAVMDYSDDHLRKILKSTRVVASVGVSKNEVRPSYFVARYLRLRGMRVIPVNPGVAGQILFGEKVYSDLGEIPASIGVDFVDIFRRSEAVPAIVEQALEVLPHLRTIWMQIGVSHPQAAATASARGVTVIQNRCPKIEYQRLFGELRMGGFSTGQISSRLPET